MVRQGLTPHDAMVGPTLDVFMHEWGHGIVRVLDIPFFAKEEDVADSLGTSSCSALPGTMRAG